MERLAVAQMAQLNRRPAELMVKHGAHAATDITGFGLLGHAYEMAAASGVALHIVAEQLPLMPEVKELAAKGMIPGGADANREYASGLTAIVGDVEPNLEAVMYDPQTSGGLLLSLPEDNVAAFENEAAEERIAVWRIGYVTELEKYPIVVS
jgi:selenide,water dikinase